MARQPHDRARPAYLRPLPSRDDAARATNRWPQVDLVAMLRECGATLTERPDGSFVGDHPWKHASKSGTCLAAWPDEGRWYCRSCKTGGDAAQLVVDHDGVTYAVACRRLEERYGPTPVRDDLPLVPVTGDVRRLAERAWRLLVEANARDQALYRRGGALVRLERDEHGRVRVAPLDAARLAWGLARVAIWTKRRADGREEPVPPPTWLVQDLLADPHPPLPALRRVVNAPVFAADGMLLDQPGFYERAGIFVDLPDELRDLAVPRAPSAEEVAAARALLCDEVCGDFPFASATSRAHALALLLLPFARELIDGPTPLHLIDAPTMASGKTLLSQAVLAPALGRTPELLSATRDDGEWRKVITSALLASADAIVLDNAERLADASLAAALTTGRWRDRLLGSSTLLNVEQRAIWVATANNCKLSPEIARRVVRSRLDAATEAPWRRTGFRHADLIGWVTEHRREIVRAALTLIQAWIAAGRPAWTGRPLASFETWSRVIGGILQVAGIDGFLGDADALIDEADTDRASWAALVTAWWAVHRDRPQAAKALLPLALDAGVAPRGHDEAEQARSLGQLLRQRRDQVIAGLRIERAGGDRTNAATWRLRQVAEPPGTGRQVEDRFRENAPEPAEVLPAFPALPANTCSTDPPGVTVAGAPEPPVRVIADAATLRQTLPALARVPVLGLDTETTGLDPLTDRLRLVQLATPMETLVIDADRVDAAMLLPLFEEAHGALLVGHNLAFDLAFLQAAGLPVPSGARLFDTMLASQLADATARPPGLADLARRYLGVELDKALQASAWDSRALTPAQIAYAARDAAVLLPLHARLADAIHAQALDAALAVEMGAIPALVWLALTGAPFDADRWQALAEAAAREEEEARAAFHAVAGADVNPASVPQVVELLRARGLAVKHASADELAACVDDPVVAALLTCREASTRAGTYGLNWLGYMHPLDGRIHPRWRQIGAATGRMACGTPNLQNIPRDPAYRACFRPEPGRVLVKADYAQIELRIAAEIAGDERLLTAFRDGTDPHAATAAAVLGKPLEAVTREERQLAKAANFGLLYGMGPDGLRRYARANYGVALTDAEARHLREAFFRAYPGLRRWHRRQPEGLATVRTLSGRRLATASFTRKLNMPVQGTGADGLKRALALLWETRGRCPSAAPVLVVHDEVVIEVDKGDAEAARAWLEDAMWRGMTEYLHRVPVEIEATICRDWSGAPVGGETGPEE